MTQTDSWLHAAVASPRRVGRRAAVMVLMGLGRRCPVLPWPVRGGGGEPGGGGDAAALGYHRYLTSTAAVAAVAQRGGGEWSRCSATEVL